MVRLKEEESSNENCKCFTDLSANIQQSDGQSQTATTAAVVNSDSNGFDPSCGCDLEVELSVPDEPVRVMQQDDAETDAIVGSLSNVPLQVLVGLHFRRMVKRTAYTFLRLIYEK